jgi:hypothetical protein
MAKRCPICHGSGVQVYRISEPITTMDYTSELTVPFRTKTYPCPECSKQVTFDELRIVKTVDSVSLYNLEFAEVRGHVEKSMTSALADKMHRMGMLHYTFKETGPAYHKVHEFAGAIGVVDKNTTKTYVETLEETRRKAIYETKQKVMAIFLKEYVGSDYIKHNIINEISRISQ